MRLFFGVLQIRGKYGIIISENTYGQLAGRTGTSTVIFGYNGRDGVITDPNGLLYMRARYYSPAMKRFVNTDIVPGRINNAVTLNRFVYANANPVMYIDPTGLFVGALIVGGILLTGLLFGLTASSPQEKSSDNQSASPDYSHETQDSHIPSLSENDINVSEQKSSIQETKKWLDKNALNDDGSYSLYDNDRHEDKNAFHEQILTITPSSPSFEIKDGSFGLGSVAADAYTGGWEWNYVDLSLMDVGHVEAGAEYKNGNVKFGALASIWSPSFSVTIGNFSFGFGAEVGAIGAGLKAGKGGVSVSGAFGLGGTFTFTFLD